MASQLTSLERPLVGSRGYSSAWSPSWSLLILTEKELRPAALQTAGIRAGWLSSVKFQGVCFSPPCNLALERALLVSSQLRGLGKDPVGCGPWKVEPSQARAPGVLRVGGGQALGPLEAAGGNNNSNKDGIIEIKEQT